MLIVPLFMRSHPLPPGALADDLHALAERGGVRVRALRVLEASAKTSASNAFVAGHGPTRRIVLFDTLLGDDPEAAESAGRDALGARARARAPRERRPLAADGRLGRRDRVRPGRRGPRAAAPAGRARAPPGRRLRDPAGAVRSAPASRRSRPGVALGWYSRRRERAADAFGVALVGEGEPFARALERLCATNLAELRPPRREQWLGASHPPPCERIAAARAAGKENRLSEANGAG